MELLRCIPLKVGLDKEESKCVPDPDMAEQREAATALLESVQ